VVGIGHFRGLIGRGISVVSFFVEVHFFVLQFQTKFGIFIIVVLLMQITINFELLARNIDMEDRYHAKL
jgi:hypothetical protein